MSGDDSNKNMILANYLHTRGFEQQKIHELLGRVHQTTISRWIKKGRDRGLWREERFFDDSGLTDEERAYVEEWEDQYGLRKAIIDWSRQHGVTPPVTQVVDSGSIGASRKDWHQRLRTFARETNRSIARLVSLPEVKTIGVGWGETLHNVLYGLSGKNSGLEVVPLCAELSRATKVLYSSTVLAQGLCEAFQGSNKVYSLTGVAALEVGQDLESSEPWREIFGPDGAIARMDMVITSASFAGRPFGHNMDLLETTSGIKETHIGNCVIGDIGGVLLPRKGKAGSAQFRELQKPWSGVSLAQLQEISCRAEAVGTPGVVLCAMGARKAPVVLEAIALGVVQHLFIDEDLATRISRLVR